MSKIPRFAAFKVIFRTSFIKACGIFNFHGELGLVKYFILKITAIDMSFALDYHCLMPKTPNYALFGLSIHFLHEQSNNL